MRLIIRDDAEAAAVYVANYIINRINEFNPCSDHPFVLGLPTGSSPIAVYKLLVQKYKAGEISFENVITFNMDEYVGIPRDHEQSYHTFMWQHLFSQINIPPDNVHILNGNAPDLEAECAAYEEAIKAAGGIDLFLAGVGADGHLAFNEPGSSLASRTRVKTLAYETVIDNARFFDNDINKVPRLALTVGVQTVLDAKEVVTIALGARKAAALQRCIEGGVNHMWTLSGLQLHQHSMVVADEDATLELQVKTVKASSYPIYLQSCIANRLKYFKSIEMVALGLGIEQKLPVTVRLSPNSPVEGKQPFTIDQGSEYVTSNSKEVAVPKLPQTVNRSMLYPNGTGVTVRSVSPDLVPDRMASRISQASGIAV
ncbi:hypothetical protein NM208_g2271 [Fusarium decemcellulare]|uniref:Uncharacterized protein n=1 Tax=Fusarium decemcellulare TaxID=57161 RepID=A0ACC1STA3_9HYPO|nr:hypothetical protein NM208_g2271 [Fusarium decemcellulare]